MAVPTYWPRGLYI